MRGEDESKIFDSLCVSTFDHRFIFACLPSFKSDVLTCLTSGCSCSQSKTVVFPTRKLHVCSSYDHRLGEEKFWKGIYLTPFIFFIKSEPSVFDGCWGHPFLTITTPIYFPSWRRKISSRVVCISFSF